MKIKRGSTSVRRLIFIGDSTSTTGAGLTGLVYNSSGLTAYYFAGDLSNEVQITLASATLGSYTSGGFVEVDATNMPGWYEVGIPDAAMDGGNEVAIQYRGATNMVPVNIYIELDAVDYQSATTFGLSKFGDIETDTQDIQNRLPAALVSGKMSSYVDETSGTALTAIAQAVAAIDILSSPYLDNSLAWVIRETYLAAGTIDTVVDTILADTNDIQTRLPAALVGGRMDASVGSMLANTLTASALASDAVTEIQSGLATSAQATAIEADTQDIQSRLPAALVGGRIDASVGAMANNVITAAAMATDASAEIADAVYEEAYAGHTTPGTYGFLWDKWRKSNPAITGEVTSAVTPTTTTFSTDITGYADTAFDNAVLVFINGSTNADFRGVVSGYLQANGQVTITPALPQAPVAGDEFVIAITSFVYTTTQTQNGLATSAGVTSAFTEIKGATWNSGTDTLEAIRDASGGGSSSITITAGAANAPARSDDTNLIAFVDETISQALAIYEADGTTAKDMSGKTLIVVFENLETTDTAVVASGSITVSGDDNNTVTWAYPSAVTSTVGKYRYALRDEAAPKTVYAQGLLFVKVAAAVD